jgi:hypothetical protein
MADSGAKEDSSRSELPGPRRKLRGAKKNEDDRRDDGGDAGEDRSTPAEAKRGNRLKNRSKNSSSASRGGRNREDVSDRDETSGNERHRNRDEGEQGDEAIGNDEENEDGEDGDNNETAGRQTPQRSSFMGSLGGSLGGMLKGSSKKKGKLGKDKRKEDDEGDENEPVVNEKQTFATGPMKVLEPIRSDPIKAYQQRAKRLERLAAAQLPEVHAVGQIKYGIGISCDLSEGVMCRYKVTCGEAWDLIGGNSVGQTQVVYPKLDLNEMLPLNHPLDMHLSQASFQSGGTPRITVQTYRLDVYGRRIMSGYGFAHIPTSSGHYNIEIPLWRPSGTPEQELAARYLGEVPSLVSAEPLFDSAWKERCRIVSQAAGKVFMDLYILTRNIEAHDIA